nr:uncharacterized protein LOC115267411 [Aedes albopictus]
MLKAELSDMNKKVTTTQKLFVGNSRNEHHPVLLYAEESDVRQFFALLTLSAQQPDELEPFITDELCAWMRMWLRPDVLGKLTEDDEKNAVKDLDGYFDEMLKREQGNSKPYLDEQFVAQFYDRFRSKIIELHPELNDTNQIYINRVLFHHTDESQSVQASIVDATLKSEVDSSLRTWAAFDCDTSEYEFEMYEALTNRVYEKMTDSQFAADLNVKLSNFRCLILTADPGMGKSALLQYVALEHQKLKPGAVFLFYLNRLQDSESKPGCAKVLGNLSSALSKKNLLFLEKVLQGTADDHITMLFDGYDEVREKNRKKINKMFKKLLKSKRIQLIISVRNYKIRAMQRFFKKHKVNVGFFSLEPFNSKNITEYLAKSWMHSENCNTPKFISFSKFLVEKFYSLCRVPLMVKMMAKIYKQRFERFIETNMADEKAELSCLEKEIPDIVHIYEKFIEKCLQVAVDDALDGMGSVDSNKQIFDGFYLDHQLQAIGFLDVYDLEFVFKNPKYMTKRAEYSNCHLIQFENSILRKFVDGKALFSHHSYAEYFVATFLWGDFVYLKHIVKHVLHCSTEIRKFFIKIIENNFILFKSEIAQEMSFVSKDVVFWACECNAVELLKYSLSKKFYLKPKKTKMLHVAIENGSDKICSYLFDERKVHPDIKDDDGKASLHLAVIHGHRNLVQLLLRRGVDINVRSTDGWSALHYAVQHKRVAISKLLIDKGIDVNARDKHKWNALHIACDNGDADLANMLKQKGAQLDAKTIEDKTALDLAALKGYTEIVKILIENMEKCSMVCTAYQIAARSGHHTVLKALESKFPKLADDVDIVEMPIHIAARKGLLKKLEKLINGGSNVNALTKAKLTPLHLSASAGHRSAIKLLLDKGANINAVNGDNVTPLYLACQNGHKNVVKILIRKGANVNITTHAKRTALHACAAKGNRAIVKILLDKGVNVNAVDKNNVTALGLASQNGHKKVVKTLKRQQRRKDKTSKGQKVKRTKSRKVKKIFPL